NGKILTGLGVFPKSPVILHRAYHRKRGRLGIDNETSGRTDALITAKGPRKVDRVYSVAILPIDVADVLSLKSPELAHVLSIVNLAGIKLHYVDDGIVWIVSQARHFVDPDKDSLGMRLQIRCIVRYGERNGNRRRQEIPGNIELGRMIIQVIGLIDVLRIHQPVKIIVETIAIRIAGGDLGGLLVTKGLRLGTFRSAEPGVHADCLALRRINQGSASMANIIGIDNTISIEIAHDILIRRRYDRRKLVDYERQMLDQALPLHVRKLKNYFLIRILCWTALAKRQHGFRQINFNSIHILGSIRVSQCYL